MWTIVTTVTSHYVIRRNTSSLKRERRRSERNERLNTENHQEMGSASTANDPSPKLQTYLDYALSLARESKFQAAASVYSVCCEQFTVSPDAIAEFTKLLIDFYLTSSKGIDPTRLIDPWSCMSCAGVLVQPVTITCGHTYCRKCLLNNTSMLCKKCGLKWQTNSEEHAKHPKVTIIVSELVKKYWSADLRAIDLRNEGNKYFYRGDIQTAVNKFTEAFQLAPGDHLVAGNRSYAYHKLNKHQDALEEAERAIACKPDWGKGYFRKGMALQSQDKFGEALVAYFHCLVLEESCSKQLWTEIVKVLHKLFTKGCEDLREKDIFKPRTSKSGSKSDALDDMYFPSIEDNSDGETENKVTKHSISNKFLTEKNRKLCHCIDKIGETVEDINNSHYPRPRAIPLEKVSREDFECPLCFRLLWHPVSTSCGHTYCKGCLDRALDHKLECPLCKTPLSFSEIKEQVNEFVEETLRRVLKSDYDERQKIFEDEMTELMGTGTDGRHEVPVFVCTMSFPTVPCPLHVFEPRYRLMIRRCMEAGTREFGMCTSALHKPFAEYGTMLEIRDIQYFPDGRSVVDTVGGRRFKVHETGTKDGYQTAKVEFLHDQIPAGQELLELKTLHDKTRDDAVAWFGEMEEGIKRGILKHYGNMPALENDYWNLSAGPAWIWWMLAILPLDSGPQQHVLSQTLLKKRLEAIGRILGFIRRRGARRLS